MTKEHIWIELFSADLFWIVQNKIEHYFSTRGNMLFWIDQIQYKT